MDNHPIPQDVTGFQFRLIGNMTVKQFAYIAVGAVGAVIIFYLPLSGLFTIMKIILIPLFILGGVALAFVPVEGRPIDIMIANFFKALFSPNQYLYHRSGGHLLLSTVHISPKIAGQAAAAGTSQAPAQHSQSARAQARQQQLAAYLNSLQQNQAPDEKDASRISTLFGPTTAGTTPTTPEATTPIPPVVSTSQPAAPQPAPVTPAPAPVAAPDAETAIKIQQDTVKLAEDEALIEQVNEELTRAKAQTQTPNATNQPTTPIDPGKVAQLEQKLQEIMAAKTQLEQELQSLKLNQVKTVAATPVANVPVTPQPAAAQAPVASPPQPTTTQAATVPTAATQPAKGSFPSLPDAPNILLGTVRDSSGNVLPNILVEVTDSEGNPVRAFKTNQLGQFMSATPLKEGTYTVSFEDARNQYKFDPAPVAVNNQILQPLEIAAHDAREELRKALFA